MTRDEARSAAELLIERWRLAERAKRADVRARMARMMLTGRAVPPDDSHEKGSPSE